MENDLIFTLYNDARTVFKLNDIAMLSKDTNFESLSKRVNYIVRNKKLLNLRKGIYTKSSYNKEELACRIYIPSYISLEYVLQKAGVIFQFNSAITSISYLSRTIEVGENELIYRKLKNEMLADMRGIIRYPDGVNIASPERALLDMLYLNGDTYFDNLNSIDKDFCFKLLPLYGSKILSERVKKLFEK
jgi:hypothetical protein